MPVPECAEGWLACFPEQPCAKHMAYWAAAANDQSQTQPPSQPEQIPVPVGAPDFRPTPQDTIAAIRPPVQVRPGLGMTDAKLVEIFTYHPPRADQIPQYNMIRSAALEFARVILANTLPCADQSWAIRCVREAVMTANAAVSLDGLV